MTEQTTDREGKETETGIREPDGAGGADMPRRVLARLGVDELSALTRDELRELARGAGLATGGGKDALTERLRAAKVGGAEGHVHGKTLCPSCSGFCVVVHTQIGQYRRLRCTNCSWRGKMAW